MSQKWVPKKPNFGSPPPGYVAGLGRGAIGFITRSDLGPMSRTNNIVKAKQIDQSIYSQNKFDSWQGYKGSLFQLNQLDQQDKQAQQAFQFCQKRMDQRRLKQKQRKMKQQQQRFKNQKKNINNMTISQQFSDLKRQLSKVTQQQWNNIPESFDSSIAKKKRQKYTPVPDSLIRSYLTNNISQSEVDNINSQNQNYRQAKQVLLKSNLQKIQNQKISDLPSFDKIGYLTHLDTNKINQQMLSDVKRARNLHKAALASNKKNPDIWLSAARIQQYDGKIQQCRNILKKALQYCPQNQDIWIQLSRVQSPIQSKNVLFQALKKLPQNQRIWHTAAKKQDSNKQMKSKILRKGLQNIPQSTKLWKQLIQLQDISQAKNLLYKAVQCLPKQVDLWIGLAKLQNYNNAKQILNKARKANPLNLSIWISAAKLQQTQSTNHTKTGKARTLIDRALMKNPKSQQIYLILIKLELKTQNKKQINLTLTKSLKQCPKSGQIWSYVILNQPHNTRKKKANVAIQNCGDSNPYINLSIAKLFWKQNKIQKAKKWIQHCLFLDKSNGDIWCYYLILLKNYYSNQFQIKKQQFLSLQINIKGRIWDKIYNQNGGYLSDNQTIIQKTIKQIKQQLDKIV